MRETWTITSGGAFVARNHLCWERFLIGLPMLLTGLWFFTKHLVFGLAEFILAGDLPGIFKNFPGWVVVMVLSACFLVPGWLLCFLRRGVLIDAKKKNLISILNFGLWRSRKVHPLEAFNQLVLLSEPGNNPGSRRWSHTLYLAGDDRNLVPIDSDTSEKDMKKNGVCPGELFGASTPLPHTR